MTILIVAKTLVTVSVVLGLSLIAERISPRWAGILSGYPTGTAINLFFFGLEIGPSFAAHSAIYNIAGLVASQLFIYIYYKTSQRFGLSLTLLISLLSYGGCITLLQLIPLDNYLIIFLPIVSIAIFTFLFKPISNEMIKERVKLSTATIALRGLAAAGIVLLITGTANLVGPTWAGLFSSFPTTLLPLMLIIHLTYGTKQVHTIIKNVPIGNVALVLYSITIALSYTQIGIYWGTLAALGIATLYLLIYQIIRSGKQRHQTAR